MMRTFTPKVNRLVTYVAAGGKLKPAVITGGIVGNTVNLRVGRAVGNTRTGIAKQTADNQVNVWRNTDAFQNT